jgi:hypothetical protein
MVERRALLMLLGSGVVLGACLGREPAAEPTHWAPPSPRRTGVDLILILAPPSPHVEPLIAAVRSELKDEFDVEVQAVHEYSTDQALALSIESAHPQAIIALDNPTALKYGRWARKQAAPPPVILAMASFVEQLRDEVPHSTGISFEPPAVTTLVDMRRLLERPIRKAGVVYREGFERQIAQEGARLATENIQLVGVRVPTRPSPRSVALALRQLQKSGIEALWVSNDNVLLSDALLAKAWLPSIRRLDLAVVVGVPGLVGGPHHLGTYAAVADIEGLGLQLADMIFELRASRWRTSSRPIQPAVSIRTYLDVTQAERLGMDPAQRATVDVLVRDKTE